MWLELLKEILKLAFGTAPGTAAGALFAPDTGGPGMVVGDQGGQQQKMAMLQALMGAGQQQAQPQQSPLAQIMAMTSPQQQQPLDIMSLLGGMRG